MKNKIKKWFWALAFFGWSVLLVILSVIPSSSIIEKSNDENNFRWDYLEHFGVFVVFAILFRLWRRTVATRKKSEVIYFLIFGSFYAASTEVLQIFVDGRTFNPIDMYLNLGGLFIGTLLAWRHIIR